MTSYLRRNLVFYETTAIISGMRGTTEPTVSYFYLDFNLILQEITDMATKKPATTSCSLLMILIPLALRRINVLRSFFDPRESWLGCQASFIHEENEVKWWMDDKNQDFLFLKKVFYLLWGCFGAKIQIFASEMQDIRYSTPWNTASPEGRTLSWCIFESLAINLTDLLTSAKENEKTFPFLSKKIWHCVRCCFNGADNTFAFI